MKTKLNTLVNQYKESPSDPLFNEIHAEIAKLWESADTIAASLRSNTHEVIAMYEDALLKCIAHYDGESEFENFYRLTIKRLRANLYHKKKRQHEREQFESVATHDDLTAATVENIADEATVESSAFTTKKADQLQLIDFLVNGADELTTAIVKTFLAHPKPTPTAIAGALGLHHSKVIRTLEKLASKFDSKQFGDFRDYLVAQ